MGVSDNVQLHVILIVQMVVITPVIQLVLLLVKIPVLILILTMPANWLIYLFQKLL